MALAVQSVSALPTSAIPTVRGNSRPMTRNVPATVNTKFVVDWSSPSTSASANKTKSNDENLQEAFRRFREERMVRETSNLELMCVFFSIVE